MGNTNNVMRNMEFGTTLADRVDNMFRATSIANEAANACGNLASAAEAFTLNAEKVNYRPAMW